MTAAAVGSARSRSHRLSFSGGLLGRSFQRQSLLDLSPGEFGETDDPSHAGRVCKSCAGRDFSMLRTLGEYLRANGFEVLRRPRRDRWLDDILILWGRKVREADSDAQSPGR